MKVFIDSFVGLSHAWRTRKLWENTTLGYDFNTNTYITYPVVQISIDVQWYFALNIDQAS